MANSKEDITRIRAAINRDRLVETAVRLVEVPSPTRNGKAVADRLAEILAKEGFKVERPEGGWPEAPAVAVRWSTGKPGKTIQFNGHLDTVHLPFVPPRVENGNLYGSGAVDMKGGVAAMVEALRVIRETGAVSQGDVLLTAHDLHEAPWGDGGQLDQLIDDGYVGDGVLIPEYFRSQLAVVGRGLGVFEVSVKRDGEPVHEVLGGIDQPNVIRVGSEIISRLAKFDNELAQRTHPMAGRESVFVGRVKSGEIYNQSPTEYEFSGTRRWLPGRSVAEVEQEWRRLLEETVAGTGTKLEAKFQLVRDAFEMNPAHPFVEAFQSVANGVLGAPLPIGAKGFVDDANSFVSRGGVPAITYGAGGKGAHTLHEEVPIAGLEETALIYVLTAAAFC